MSQSVAKNQILIVGEQEKTCGFIIFCGKLRELSRVFCKTFPEVLTSFSLSGPCFVNLCLDEKQGTALPYTGIISWP